MTSNNHFTKEIRNFFILLCKNDGKRPCELGVPEKDCSVGAGTLVELLDPLETVSPHSHRKYRFRTLAPSDIYLTCYYNDVDVLDIASFQLLLPIQSLKDRLFVFKEKQWLNDGIFLKVGDRVFVRPKQTQTEIEGWVQWKGPIDDTGGVYFGVELKENRGTCDGTYNNTAFFRCHPNFGVFVPLNRLRRNRQDWQRTDLLRAGDLQALVSSQLQIEIEERVPRVAASNHLYDMDASTSLKKGDRVIWPSDNGYEHGTVRWIGVLPDEIKENITIGVEFDNPVGTGTGKYKDQRLFYTRQGHASLIPPLGLMREEIHQDPILSDQEKLLNKWQRNKGFSHDEIQARPQNSKANIKSSLPNQFNHYTDYMEPVNGASSYPMNEQPYKQGKTPQTISNGHHQDRLTVGCMVEVRASKTPLYGVIRWIGSVDNNITKLMAGLELESDHSAGTNGVFKNVQKFHCKPGRALFVPLKNCVRDKRFLNSPEMTPGLSPIESPASPDVQGDIPPREIYSFSELQEICGKNRGIQGHHNSCYLDSTLFSMFYFTTVFDSIFNRPPKPNDLPEYTQVQRVLKEGIVNPLRKHNYVASNNVWKLRTLLDKLGTVEGMMGEEKDVEEFLSALLSQIMKADPLLHLSTGEHTYFYQLFMEKDENLLLPTTQKLVELSFLQGNVKLKEVPACLMIQMPRFGKDYKMFRRIVPSLQLDITDIMENSPRDCIVCGDLATWECKKCYQVHGQGLNTTAFCDKCRTKSHQHVQRKEHQPVPIPTDAYQSYFQHQKDEGQGDTVLTLPRDKMELFAVICIQTSHYVSFVKCGPGVDAPWVFFDSMADRIGEQGGFNVPQVTHVPEMRSWLSEQNLISLNKDEDKELPEHLRRLLCDGYMCMYQSPDVMMFQ